MTTLSKELAELIFAATSDDDVTEWLARASIEAGGLTRTSLGGIDNNPHTVEVASDPALALVEIPVNSIDALLDLAARERGEQAPTPHEAARRWFDVPAAGLGALSTTARAALGERLRLTVRESGDARRPTIEVQEQGTGQHPDDWSGTLLSLLASNKKTKGHQMGVYNAGGSASCRYARSKVVVSRLAPSLLDGRSDRVGVSVIRYDPLDPDRYKSGSYRYVTDKDGHILLLDIDELPEMPYGTYIKLIEYELSRYAGAAYAPQRSLWHLLHSALPQPPLPMQIVETRGNRFTGVRGEAERRTVAGLLHLLGRKGTADYHDVRPIDMGADMGKITLRYYVLNEGLDPDAYVTSDQGLTITLNGQRQITKDRAWVKRNTELNFVFRRLLIVVDGTTLTNAAKREIFSSTRETGADTPETRAVLDRVVAELKADENLYAYDEAQKQKALEHATRTTTRKVKRQLASQIGAYLQGDMKGTQGGQRKPDRPARPPRPPKPPDVDDSLMLDVPDQLKILSDPLRLEPGGASALRLEINAKNDFLPAYADGLAIVVGPELAGQVSVRSKGRLLGGKVRVTMEAATGCPEVESSLQVALAVPDLGVLLTASGKVTVKARAERKEKDSPKGGEPDIEIHWLDRSKWETMTPSWDGETVGVCNVTHGDDGNPEAITKVEWILNEEFAEYARLAATRKGDSAVTTFREGYEMPVAFGLFRQRLAEVAKEKEADESGESIEIPDDYVRGEQARLARAVLMAMAPDVAVAAKADAA